MSSSASAPGKVILLGEHAVVYGKPAVAIAIDREVRTTVEDSDVLMLNGSTIDLEYHPHIEHILSKYGDMKVSITTDTNLPPSSGLGSSAAFSSSLICAMRMRKNLKFDVMEIAKESFETEYAVQGRASPIDTYTASLGNGIVLNCPDGLGEPIAEVTKNGNAWKVSRIKVPDMTLVVGYTGIKSNTGPIVERVRRFMDKNTFAREVVDEIGNITEEGIRAMTRNDLSKLGDIMLKDHKLLSILGTSCNELNKLVDAAMKYSYGAKLTGSGGGGSMIALTDEPMKVAEAIILHGGLPFVVRTNPKGVGEV